MKAALSVRRDDVERIAHRESRDQGVVAQQHDGQSVDEDEVVRGEDDVGHPATGAAASPE
jgi:hypothetical protein